MISLDDSILGKMSMLILEDVEEVFIGDLLDMKLRKFSDIGEFDLALDVLFALGRLDIDEKRGVIRYAS
jgi:hypothetical protein